MNHVRKQGAQFVLCLKSAAFKLYDKNGQEYDLTAVLKRGDCDKTFRLNLFYKQDKEYVTLRICVLEKSAEDAEKSRRHLKNNDTEPRSLSNSQEIWSRYVVVATSLPE